MPDDEVQLSPTHEDAVRALERLADRLRVTGPRLSARGGQEAREALQAIRAGLQHLADLAADADSRPRRAVPDVAGFALADQALVLGHDLIGLEPQARGDLFRASAVQAIEDIRRPL